MRLTRHALLPFCRDVVFERARDELPRLAASLPDIASVEPIFRAERASTVERVDRLWTRPLGESRVAVPTMTLSLLARTTWDSKRHRVAWAIELTEPIETQAARGVIRMRARGGSETEVALSGDLVVDAGRLVAPLRAISFALRPLLERRVQQALERNLAAMVAGFADLFDEPISRAS